MKNMKSTSHPKWKEHLDETLSTSSGVNLPPEVIKLIQSYSEYYSIYDDKIPPIPPTIPSEGGIVNYFVQRTHEDVRTLTYYGRGNVHEDIVASQGMSHAAFQVIRDDLLANIGATPLFRELASLVPGDVRKDRVAEMLVRPMLSVSLGAGNCHEQSAMALQIMLRHWDCNMELQKEIKEISVVKAMVDHIFVKITSRDATIYVCDPWNNFSGKLDDDFDSSPGYAKCIIHPQDIYMMRGLTEYLTSAEVSALHRLSHQGHDPFTILEAVSKRDNSGLKGAAHSLVEYLINIRECYGPDSLKRLAATSMGQLATLTGIHHEPKSTVQIEVIDTASNTAAAAANPSGTTPQVKHIT